MFIERLLNSGPTPLLEQSIQFAASRQKLLAADFANVDTVGYQQKDLDVKGFQNALLERAEQRGRAREVSFDDIAGASDDSAHNILFHDHNNRSMEELSAESAKNTFFHNTMIELLRKQISQLEMALKEHVS